MPRLRPTRTTSKPPPSLLHNGEVKRVAIFGSHGQLGVELASTFSARSYEVASFERASVDITDAAAVERAIAHYDPAIVLNSAAYNKVDLAESDPESAFRVNALAVRNLALACRNADAQLVHFSTDYVFDGLAGQAYQETDPTRPWARTPSPSWRVNSMREPTWKTRW